MKLNASLLATLVKLGVTDEEVAMLTSHMLSTVTSLGASLNALDGQINTLQSQREALLSELDKANGTVTKLLED